MTPENYLTFLKSKIEIAPESGFEIQDGDINPILKPHQKAIVKWMVRNGRSACFAAFGLGKTIIQIEAVRLTLQRTGGRVPYIEVGAAVERRCYVG